MFFRSIRWRLQVWHALLLFVVLAGFGVTAHRLQYGNELRRVDQELDQRVSVLLGTLRRQGPPRRGPDGEPPPLRGGFRLPDEHASMFSQTGSNAFYYLLWRRDGAELSRSSNAPVELQPPPRDAQHGLARSFRTRADVREAICFTPPGECVLVGRSIAPELIGLQQLGLWLAGLGAGVLALGLAGGWWLAARAIRPIDDISAAASRIATGDLSHRISTTETDNELGHLAGVLNSTFSRLEAAFAQQARFTADASHELRTPLTVILSQTQMALAREREPADYRETLEACQRAAQRMRRMMESLLELARLDAGQDTMNQMPFDLARVAGEVVELLRPLADEKKITLELDLAAAECEGDADRIAQVITNLVSNAIHHHREGGNVRVTTRRENHDAILMVADNGPGIPPEHLPRIFDRFYRADAARTSSHGHAGLGLAISKAIVEAHTGTIEVESPPGAGATFTVKLPAMKSAPADA